MAGIRQGLFLLSEFQIVLHHLANQLFKGDLWLPTELSPYFTRIAEEIVDIGGPEIAWVCFDMTAPVDAVIERRQIEKLSDGMRLAGGDYIIIRLLGLHHHPHCFHVIAGVTPVPLGGQV